MQTITSIRVKELTAGYQKKVICRLSFELNCPNFLVICGRNGAGKSTFLQCLGGKMSYQGGIFINDAPMPKNPAQQHILTLLSQHNHLHFSITALELVLMGKMSRKKWSEKLQKQDIAQAEQLLERLKIGHLKNRDVKTLSGGEQQLVWLAQAAIQETPLLILDEPTHFLDIANKFLVFNWIQELVQQGRTVICVTHDLYQLQQFSGRIINLSDNLPQISPLQQDILLQHIHQLENSY